MDQRFIKSFFISFLREFPAESTIIRRRRESFRLEPKFTPRGQHGQPPLVIPDNGNRPPFDFDTLRPCTTRAACLETQHLLVQIDISDHLRSLASKVQDRTHYHERAQPNKQQRIGTEFFRDTGIKVKPAAPVEQHPISANGDYGCFQPCGRERGIRPVFVTPHPNGYLQPPPPPGRTPRLSRRGRSPSCKAGRP